MAKGAWGITAVDLHGEAMDGTSGARLASFQGIVKQNSAGSPYLVANEFLCGRLALCLGLPTPAGDILRFPDDSLGYVSLRFGTERPPPVIPSDFVRDNPDLALRIAAFDCWIANDDRHAGNLAYSKGLIPPMIFDHDKAILGPGEDGLSGVDRLEEFENTAILNGCTVRHVKDLKGVYDRVSEIADHIRGIATQSLPGLCATAEQAGAFDAETREAVERFLTVRAKSLVKLMTGLNARGQLPIS